MKLIISIIRPEKLPDVKQSLWDNQIRMMTVIDMKGCGQQKGYKEEYRGIIEEVQLHRKAMILIAVNESYVNKTVKAIVKGARTNDGKVGDGKIFRAAFARGIGPAKGFGFGMLVLQPA